MLKNNFSQSGRKQYFKLLHKVWYSPFLKFEKYINILQNIMHNQKFLELKKKY